ncbi:hypothetical protein ACETK8_20075 (plasmid) [Brevundimonas staleyi]|uniref:DUF3572 family protein n=1 Tax=Brevundimonas staleyi TaxID=74326 RepID=A0ABW0FNV0_9CAUL
MTATHEDALDRLIADGLTFGQALNRFAALQRRDEPALDRYVDRARETWHRDGAVEIDDPGVIVSDSEDPGAYVLAWVWVDD